MKTPTILPESFLRLMSAEDRSKLGKGGITAQEAASRAQVRNERHLQSLIVNLLRLKGVEPIVSRTDKRISNNLGTPDIIFAVKETWPDLPEIIPCGWEIKYGEGKLSPEQVAMHIRLQTPPNAWRVRTIRSVNEALAELKEMGIS